MPNMMDYLELMSDVPLTEKPWQPLDSLLMANVCYNKLGALAATQEGMTLSRLAPRVDLSPYASLPFHEERKALLNAMAASLRFGDAAAACYVDIKDNTKPIQFSAMTMLTPGAGVVVCFRGTDNTITGWREDLYMSFESPVPGQVAALAYLNEIAKRYRGPLILTGHSKGGNLAAYAASHTTEDVQQRILWVDCFDSPGLDDATLASESYARVKHVIRCYIPQNSVIGLLMNSDLPMTVIRSSAAGLQQHDAFTWQTVGEQFQTLTNTTLSSQLTDRTLDLWLLNSTPQQRRVCVDAVFDLLDATDADTISAMRANPAHSLTRILAAARKLDAETLPVFLHMAAALFQSGASSAVDMVAASQIAEELSRVATSLPTEQLKQLVNAAPVDKVRNLMQNVASESKRLAANAEQLLPGAAEQLKQRFTGFSRELVQRLQASSDKTNKPAPTDEGGPHYES